MLVCFIHFAREAAGATGTRLSLRPLFFRGPKIPAPLGRIAPREGGRMSRELLLMVNVYGVVGMTIDVA
jgi:hypothetical protein